MNCLNVLRAHRPAKGLDGCLQTILFANIISGGEGMRGVKTNTKREFGAGINDLAQMFKAMADAFTLPGRIFQQDPQRAKSQSLARNLQAQRAFRKPFSRASAARAARMNDQI